MAAPYSNLRSKIDRAIVAYLKTVLPDGTLIYPANNSGPMEPGKSCIVVKAHNGRPEVKMSGIWRFNVQIQVLYPSAPQPGQMNPDDNRVGLDQLFSKTVDALMQTDETAGQTLQATASLITEKGRLLATTGSPQEKANNSDMTDFTCQFWCESGLDGGHAQTAEGIDHNRFVEMATFECVASPSNVD